MHLIRGVGRDTLELTWRDVFRLAWYLILLARTNSARVSFVVKLEGW